MVSQRTFSEFMEICEAKVPVTRQAGEFRYSGRTGEEKAERRAKVLSNSPDPKKRRQANTIRSKIKTVADRDTARASSDARQKLYRGQQRRANDLASQLMKKEETELGEKFSMAADASQPQSPKATKLPKSRERNVGRHDDWKDKETEWGERPAAGKKLKSRASAVVGTQQRQDVETGVRKEEAQLDEVVVTRSPEIKQRAKNIKKIRDKKEALAALMKHAKLQKQGLADEVEYDGENVDEILMVTPTSKQKITKTLVRKAVKIEKPDPNDPDYVRKYREYIKSKQRNEEIDIDEVFGIRKTIKRWKSEADAAEKAKYDKGSEMSRNRRERMKEIGLIKSKKKKPSGGYTVDTSRPEKKVTTFGKGGETRTYKTKSAV